MATKLTVTREQVLEYHLGGKIRLGLPRPVASQRDLCLAYTPGVAQAVKAIAASPALSFDYTSRSNLVAVVSDGTAILGLGDLGALASVPVMEMNVQFVSGLETIALVVSTV